MDDKIEITEDTLYRLFRVYDVMSLIDEWEDYNDDLKAHYLFNLIKKIHEEKDT